MASKRSEFKESHYGALMQEWLGSWGWEVYCEVQTGYGGPRADIVAVRGKALWVIEVKKSASLTLMDQLLNWKGKANFVSSVTPYLKLSRAYTQFCHDHGFGHLFVSDYGDGNIARFKIRNRMFRRPDDQGVRRYLSEHQKGWGVAGNSEGEYYTPYRQTCRDLVSVVAFAPGIVMKDAIKRIKHHYKTDSTAYSALSQWLSLGKVRGVRSVRDGKCVRLYLTGESVNEKA